MSTLSKFLHNQRARWYRRGIDPSHHLRRRLAYYVAEHGFEIGERLPAYACVILIRNRRAT